MTYVLIEQHYSIAPTRQASRWRREHTVEILETDSLQEAAEKVVKLPTRANVDVFCYALDDSAIGRRPLTRAELDEYWDYRKKEGRK